MLPDCLICLKKQKLCIPASNSIQGAIQLELQWLFIYLVVQVISFDLSEIDGSEDFDGDNDHVGL